MASKKGRLLDVLGSLWATLATKSRQEKRREGRGMEGYRKERKKGRKMWQGHISFWSTQGAEEEDPPMPQGHPMPAVSMAWSKPCKECSLQADEGSDYCQFHAPSGSEVLTAHEHCNPHSHLSHVALTLT